MGYALLNIIERPWSEIYIIILPLHKSFINLLKFDCKSISSAGPLKKINSYNAITETAKKMFMLLMLSHRAISVKAPAVTEITLDG